VGFINPRYFLGFNCGTLAEFAEEYVIAKLDGGQDEWEDKEWGFCEPMNFTNSHNDTLYELDQCNDPDEYFIENRRDGELIIKNNHPNFEKIIHFALNTEPNFLNQNKQEIPKGAWLEKLKSTSDFTITICECEPGA